MHLFFFTLPPLCRKYDQCWHKIPLIDILAIEAYSGKLPATAEVSNGNSLGQG